MRCCVAIPRPPAGHRANIGGRPRASAPRARRREAARAGRRDHTPPTISCTGKKRNDKREIEEEMNEWIQEKEIR
jgi:hypothetical protein